MMKFFIFFLLLSLFSCHSGNNLDHSKLLSESFLNVQKLTTDTGGLSNSSATIKTVHGDIVFRFYTKKAPTTTARIMYLIQNKFYDGMIFHRAIPNFIVQTGDPTGTGKGGSGITIPTEHSDLQHIRGTIGLAHGLNDPSGDSQFYICLTTLSHLDGKNNVFGQVVEGLDILQKLSKGDRILSITLNIKN